MELSNSKLEQEAVDADLQRKSAEADYQNIKVKVQSDLLNYQAEVPTVEADYDEAKTSASANKELVKWEYFQIRR